MCQAEVVPYFPYMVSIKQSVHDRLKICGGTVLTNTLTLTAAHCLLNGLIGLHLQFGSLRLFEGKFYEATTIVIHRDFNSRSLTHDIGLISIFPSKVYFGFNIQPVKLPDKEFIWNSETLITVYGWGAISDTKSFSKVLRSAALPVLKKNTCEFLLKSQVLVNTFCLGYLDGHVDSCQGDSGGPAMLDDIQIGIISFGEGCAEPLKPGVYTDLRKYTDWLQETLVTIV